MKQSFTSWENELYHYGIPGMKWGVRRFQNSDGSLTAAGQKRYGGNGGQSLGRKIGYKMDAARLNRLKNRADLNVQRQNVEKFDRRKRTAVKVGTAAGLAGAALIGGSHGVKHVNGLINAATHNKLQGLQSASDRILGDSTRALKNIYKDGAVKGSKKDLADQITSEMRRKLDANKQIADNTLSSLNKGSAIRGGISRATSIAGKAALGGAAVSFGYAAYNHIQSNLSKKRLTDEGHKKAVEKYKSEYSRLMEKYTNTPYEELLKKKG